MMGGGPPYPTYHNPSFLLLVSFESTVILSFTERGMTSAILYDMGYVGRQTGTVMYLSLYIYMHVYVYV